MSNQKQPELFGIKAMDLRSPKPFWIRTAARLMNVISELEIELKRMKEKELPEELILAKDNQINELVEFYDTTCSIIENYELIIKFNTINAKLNESIFKAENRAQDSSGSNQAKKG